jgi:putative ABC transport system permease protein
MTAIQFAMAHLKHRAATTTLILALLTLGLATVIALSLLIKQIENRLAKDSKGIDLVVGATPDAAQMTGAYVFHIDAPSAAMSLTEADRVRNNPLLSWSAPLVLGDSYKGFRIVGTEQKFSFLYGAILQEGGSFWGTPYDVVVGSSAAKRTGLQLGDRFKITHGLARDGKVHDQAYVVTGVLQPTDAVIDQLILTSMQSLWDMHGNDDVTALLVRSKSPQAVVELLRGQKNLYAAVPNTITTELRDQLRQQLRPYIWCGYSLIGLGLVMIFITLLKSLAARRDDMAMLRVMGATPGRLLRCIMAEGVLLVSGGIVCGWLLAHLGVEALSWMLPNTKAVGVSGFALAPDELWLLPSIFLLGTLAALYPAWHLSRTHVLDTLAKD